MQENLNQLNMPYYYRIGSIEWGNTNGTSKTFSMMDHSYISNVYWHLRTRYKLTDTKEAMDFKLALELHDYIVFKFGHVLDYRPWTLRDKETLVAQERVKDGYIFYGDLFIGHLEGQQEDAASYGVDVHKEIEAMLMTPLAPLASPANQQDYLTPEEEMDEEWRVLVDVGGAYLPALVIKHYDYPTYELVLDRGDSLPSVTMFGVTEDMIRFI